jgi:SAM-dependent methyltransferase
MAWYREWFGQDYVDLYAHRDQAEAETHVDFVEAQLVPEGGPRPRAVLDLACGGGRHTEALRNRGYRTLGVDLSLTLLALRPALPRVRGDMRGLPFTDASFDWVLNFFTSFGYFESERENFRVLEEIVRILAPGGRFMIDFFNRDRVIAELEPRQVLDDNGRRVDIQRWYDPTSRRINKRIVVRHRMGPPRAFLESVRAYRREEVVMGLGWGGLELTGVYGNFKGDPYHRDSERLILVGRKPD